MKRIILSLILIMSLFSVVYAYETSYSTTSISGEGIEIRSLKYEPYPVQPGEIFTIYFVFRNAGDEFAPDATCKIVNDNIFTAYGKDTISAGSLAIGREFGFEFEVKVNEDAYERTEELEVRCAKNPYAANWAIHKIPIKIQHRFTTVNIDSVKTNPEMLEIGRQGEIILSIANNAQVTLRDIAVELDFATTQIAPADGITVKKISNIKSNDIVDLTFNVFTMPDTEPNFYKIPTTIEYVDVNGDTQTLETLITLKIGGKPSYYIVPESYATIGGGAKQIELKFVNNGLADMQFFNVKVLDKNGFNVVSGQEIYIGDLDSDDYLTETITGKSFWGGFDIALEITYQDKLGNDYKDIVNVKFDPNKIKNISQTSSFSRIVIILILGGIAYYIYRRKKRAKHAT